MQLQAQKKEELQRKAEKRQQEDLKSYKTLFDAQEEHHGVHSDAKNFADYEGGWARPVGAHAAPR